MTDPRTGQSRGYGFVRFLHQLDQIQAMNEMQGFVIGNRPIRVSLATPKHHTNQQLNTTVFVGGLSCPISEDELKQYFHIFGDIVYVKIPPGKGCGFVQYVSRYAAELAIEQMNGYQIGSSRIRLSWGKSQQQADKKQSFTSPSSSLVSPSFIHPFDEDQGFMTVFSSNNYINLDPVTAATSAASPTATTQSVTSSGHHASSWPTDCHHIFAQ
jgi:RNA recognition motif-containing protein